MTAHYPYMQLDFLYGFTSKHSMPEGRILQEGFSQGFTNNSTFKNVFLTKNDLKSEAKAYAFDLGRHFLKRYFNASLPYREELFK